MRVDAEPVVLPNSSGSMAHTLHDQGPRLPNAGTKATDTHPVLLRRRTKPVGRWPHLAW
jgi:hypothetical protein